MPLNVPFPPPIAQAARLALVCLGLTACSARCGAADGFTPLFDGESLDGWTTADGRPVTKGWEAEDGLLVRTGGGGSIYTAEEYDDFELRFEWKISRRGNSGVKYRVDFYQRGVFGRPGWLGYEYQIWDDANRGTSAETSAASIYLLQAPKQDKPLQPTGQFNTARIVAVGPHIEHWLGGERVLAVDTDSQAWRERIAPTKFGPIEDVFQNRSGRILLQDHGSKVWFRNLEIREIESQ